MGAGGLAPGSVQGKDVSRILKWGELCKKLCLPSAARQIEGANRPSQGLLGESGGMRPRKFFEKMHLKLAF